MARKRPEIAMAASGLRKRFGHGEDAVVALDGLDLEVEAGTVYGLLGPNGAGKTTAVRILTTIFRPDEGSAHVLGFDVVADAPKVRRTIGLAGQFAAVDENLTGRENLKLVGRLTHLDRATVKSRSNELLERFDLVDAADRPAKTYSGGMRRRLDVAAALVHRPPVLFLDEPTTGLDPHSRNELWGVIGELVSEGATVLLTTQYLEEADRVAQRIAVVDRGTVIAEGTPKQLKRNLGATVLEVTFSDEKKAERALEALQQTTRKRAIQHGSAVELPVTDGSKFVATVLSTLNRKRLAPAGLTVREPSLDDVFLALTGHRAEETNGEAASPDVSTNGRTRKPSRKAGANQRRASTGKRKPS